MPVWLLFAGTACAQADAPIEPHEVFVCRHGADTRLVSIFDANAAEDRRQLGGCRVDYTREGRTDTVWTSKTNHAYCIQKAITLVTKLGQSRFACTPQTVAHAPPPASPADRTR